MIGLENEQCAAIKKQLLDDLETFTLPPNPLDKLIDELGGHTQVAEMTGRRVRMIKVPEKGYVMASRGREEKVNLSERARFMKGEKCIAIISDAASTGISLHADARCKNTRRRIHITMELPWSAEKAIQQLGRSHRSNQVSAPLYELMTTNLGGEKSFVSRVAKRMMTLVSRKNTSRM